MVIQDEKNSWIHLIPYSPIYIGVLYILASHFNSVKIQGINFSSYKKEKGGKHLVLLLTYLNNISFEEIEERRLFPGTFWNKHTKKKNSTSNPKKKNLKKWL